ncbi:MAG: hypothetical protein AB1817_16270, partial [Chloroflexota bacterium]
MNALRTARQCAIEQQIRRLERRLVPLRNSSNRVSWLRVGVFIAGIAAALGIGNQVNALAGWG